VTEADYELSGVWQGYAGRSNFDTELEVATETALAVSQLSFVGMSAPTSWVLVDVLLHGARSSFAHLRHARLARFDAAHPLD
jgi:hypothetical protein